MTGHTRAVFADEQASEAVAILPHAIRQGSDVEHQLSTGRAVGIGIEPDWRSAHGSLYPRCQLHVTIAVHQTIIEWQQHELTSASVFSFARRAPKILHVLSIRLRAGGERWMLVAPVQGEVTVQRPLIEERRADQMQARATEAGQAGDGVQTERTVVPGNELDRKSVV